MVLSLWEGRTLGLQEMDFMQPRERFRATKEVIVHLEGGQTTTLLFPAQFGIDRNGEFKVRYNPSIKNSIQVGTLAHKLHYATDVTRVYLTIVQKQLSSIVIT